LELGGEGEDTAELELGNEEPEESQEPTEKIEGTGAPAKNLEKSNFNKDKNPDDLDEPKKIKKVFLKRPKQVKK
jgi:hypothetical protein